MLREVNEADFDSCMLTARSILKDEQAALSSVFPLMAIETTNSLYQIMHDLWQDNEVTPNEAASRIMGLLVNKVVAD